MAAGENRVTPTNEGAMLALKRASRRAFDLAVATGTPFYVIQNGKIIDLNRQKSRRKKKSTLAFGR